MNCITAFSSNATPLFRAGVKTGSFLRGSGLGFVLSMILGLSAPHAVAATTWQSSDIGDVGAPGSANGTNDSLIVAGAGADIYAEADAFQFAYQPWNGDGEIVARISRLEDINPWSKAGLMFRGSLEANSANVFIFMTPENGVGIQSRTNTGGSTDFSPATFVTPPAWLKLVGRASTAVGLPVGSVRSA